MLLHFTWLFVGVFTKLQKWRVINFVRPSVRPSMRMEQHGSHWKDFLEIWCLRIFQKSVKNIQISLKSDKNNFINKFMTSHWIYLGMRNVSDRGCRENQNAHFMLSNFFLQEICAIYEVMWKNMVNPEATYDNKICVCSACWITKLQTHTQNMLYLVLLHGNSGYAIAPQCYVYTYIAYCSVWK
jgi:hypothetical protein